MFDSLSGKLQSAFRNLRGLGKISEANVGDSLREVRLALLEADVNFKVARDFIDMHHGTRLVAYFFHQAKEKVGGDVTEDSFRYHGRKPHNKP